MTKKHSRVFISIEDDADKSQLIVDGSLGLLRDLISTLSNDEAHDVAEQKSSHSGDTKGGSDD